jgi:hypothetical protein
VENNLKTNGNRFAAQLKKEKNSAKLLQKTGQKL